MAIALLKVWMIFLKTKNQRFFTEKATCEKKTMLLNLWQTPERTICFQTDKSESNRSSMSYNMLQEIT